MSKSYGHLCQIYHNHLLDMVMSRDSGFKFRKLLFFAQFYINFRKSYQIWGKLAQEQKVTGKKKTIGGGKHTPPPSSAYRVTNGFLPLVCKFKPYRQTWYQKFIRTYLPLKTLQLLLSTVFNIRAALHLQFAIS